MWESQNGPARGQPLHTTGAEPIARERPGVASAVDGDNEAARRREPQEPEQQEKDVGAPENKMVKGAPSKK